MDRVLRDQRRSLSWGDFGSVALVLGTLILALGLVSLTDQFRATRSPLGSPTAGPVVRDSVAPVSAHQQPYPHRQPQRRLPSRPAPLQGDAI